MSTNIEIFNNSSVKIIILPWNAYPGQWIVNQAETPKKAQILFDNFVTKKMPEALGIITQLNNGQHLSPVHLSMNIASIFLTFVTEQIELYQNQKETRDLEVDKKFQLFKEAFAKERHHLFTHNPKWANAFFDDLKSSLIKADVFAEDFDKTISLWLKLISIVHIGDMDFASCFHKDAKTVKLSPLKCVYADLQRRNIESSFHLLVNQLSQDLQWIVLKLGNKMAFPEDQELQTLFFVTTSTNSMEVENCLQNRAPYVNAASVFQDDLKSLLHDLISLNLANNDEINICLTRLQNIRDHIKCYEDLTICLGAMQKTELSSTTLNICGPASHRVMLTKENFPKLLSLTEDRQECHLLMDCYLFSPCHTLDRIFQVLVTSNLAIEKFNKEGIPLPSVTQSLLPPPSLQRYNEKAFLELCATPIPDHNPKRNKTKNSAPKNPPKKEEKKINSNVAQKPAATPTPMPIPLEKTITIPLINSLEQLRRQLLALHHAKPITPLRQALWHLDALISLQDALQNPAMSAEKLTLLNMAAGSAHRLLEQTYRTCLEIRNIEPITSHNLKEYHRALDTSSYPDIVQKLYLANHWTRYFYLENEKWTFSTQARNIPSVVVDLVKLADGVKNPSLTKDVLEMIEKTRAHVEKILPKLDIPLPDGYLAEDAPLQLKKLPLNLNGFNEIQKSLSTFLATASFSNHHPVYLHLKQAIAAIGILKGSLQGIQKAKNPRELASWTSLCMQQIQETTENIFHAIEFFQEHETSSLHDLKKLSLKLNLEMGALADACHLLSYKSRYPVENLSDSLGAQLIDDVEIFRQYPDYLNGFKIVGDSPMLWKQPGKNLSLPDFITRLTGFIESTHVFLQKQALPALFKLKND